MAGFVFPECYQLLIIDDNELNLDILASYFKQLGLDVDTCNNGKIGLIKAQKQQPDLILLNYIMPRMDGLEFLRRFRTFRMAIPIFFYSAILDQQLNRKARKLGATNCFQSPLDLNLLVFQMIKHLMNDRFIYVNSLGKTLFHTGLVFNLFRYGKTIYLNLKGSLNSSNVQGILWESNHQQKYSNSSIIEDVILNTTDLIEPDAQAYIASPDNPADLENPSSDINNAIKDLLTGLTGWSGIKEDAVYHLVIPSKKIRKLFHTVCDEFHLNTITHDTIPYNVLDRPLLSIRYKAGSFIEKMRISATGKTLACGYENHCVSLYRTGDFKRITTILLPSDSIWNFSLAGDDRLLATWNKGNRVSLWSVETGLEVATRSYPPSLSVAIIEFCQDGQLLITGYHNGCIEITKVYTGKIQGFFTEHQTELIGIGSHHHSNLVGSICMNGEVKIWCPYTFKVKQSFTIAMEGAFPLQAVFSSDLSQLALVLDDRINVYSIASGQLIEVIQTSDQRSIRSLHFSPDNTLLLFGIEKRGVRIHPLIRNAWYATLPDYILHGLDGLFNPRTEDLILPHKNGFHTFSRIFYASNRVYTLNRGSYRSFTWDTEESRFFASDDQGNLWIWEIIKGNQVRRVEGIASQLRHLQYKNDKLYFTENYSGGPRSFHLTHFHQNHIKSAAKPVKAMKLSPGGKWIVQQVGLTKLVIWNMENHNIRWLIYDLENPILDFVLFPDETHLLLLDSRFSLSIWDIASTRMLIKEPLPVHLPLKYKPNVAILPSSDDFLVIADQNVLYFNWRKRLELVAWTTLEHDAVKTAIDTTTSQLAYIDKENFLHVFHFSISNQTIQLNPILEIFTTEDQVGYMEFSPRGNYLILSANDLVMYRVHPQSSFQNSCSEKQNLNEMGIKGWDVHYGKDLLAVLSDRYRNICLWSLTTGRFVDQLQVNNQIIDSRLHSKVQTLQFTPDGSKLTTTQPTLTWDLRKKPYGINEPHIVYSEAYHDFRLAYDYKGDTLLSIGWNENPTQFQTAHRATLYSCLNGKPMLNLIEKVLIPGSDKPTQTRIVDMAYTYDGCYILMLLKPIQSGSHFYINAYSAESGMDLHVYYPIHHQALRLFTVKNKNTFYVIVQPRVGKFAIIEYCIDGLITHEPTLEENIIVRGEDIDPKVMAADPDGHAYYFKGTIPGDIFVLDWNNEDNKYLSLPLNSQITDIKVSPEGDVLLISTEDGILTWWGMLDWRIILQMQLMETTDSKGKHQPVAVYYTPDGRFDCPEYMIDRLLNRQVIHTKAAREHMISNYSPGLFQQIMEKHTIMPY